MTDKQRGVLRGMAAAGAITVAGVTAGLWFAPDALTPAGDLASRLAFALRWDMLVVLWLLASIGMLARQRFFNPEDIDGGGLTAGSAQSKVLQSVLQNTLEQAVLAVFVHVAWAPSCRSSGWRCCRWRRSCSRSADCSSGAATIAARPAARSASA
ncbi:MAG: hypothetical protein VCC99_01040 [Alphaproteobacteria bacterium]